MKITKTQLKQIIREELNRTLSEGDEHDPLSNIGKELSDAFVAIGKARDKAMEMYNTNDNEGFRIIKQFIGQLNESFQQHAQYQDATEPSSEREEL
jgi:hypothetical protein